MKSSVQNLLATTSYMQTIIVSHNYLWFLKYSEKSENIIGLDSYILNRFSYLSPI